MGTARPTGPLLWYAETNPRRTRQLVADGLVVAWTWLWWRLAGATHDLVTGLGAPGRDLAAAGDRLRGGFRSAGDAVDGTPLVGGALEAPFRELADAAGTIAGLGAAQEAAAGTLADWAGALVLLVPVLTVGLVWGVVRVRGARRGGEARMLRETGEHDLLALRALARRPLRQLLAVTATPAADWRAGRVEELAAVELRAQGLRP